MGELYAVSIRQPWATWIALGEKKYETRTWKPDTEHIGNLVAIHASKKFLDEDQKLCLTDRTHRLLCHERNMMTGDFPCGYIVGVARMRDFLTVVESPTSGVRLMQSTLHRNNYIAPPVRGLQEDVLGDFSVGRCVWELSEPAALANPIPSRGALSLWAVPMIVRREVVKELNAGGHTKYAREIALTIPAIDHGGKTLEDLFA